MRQLGNHILSYKREDEPLVVQTHAPRAGESFFQSREISTTCLKSNHALKFGTRLTRTSGLHSLKRSVKLEKIYGYMSIRISPVGWTNTTLKSRRYQRRTYRHLPYRGLAYCYTTFLSHSRTGNSPLYKSNSGRVWRKLQDPQFSADRDGSRWIEAKFS